jgi:membrane protein
MSKRPKLAKALRLTISAFRRHNASRFGAALAFYIVFSIAPMLLIAIAIAGSLLGRDEAERQILDRIGGSFGSAAGAAIAAMIKDAPRRTGWLPTAIGFVTLGFSLSGVYEQIDDALQLIFHERRHEKREQGPGTIRSFERKIGRILLVLGAVLVVLVSVVADAAIAMTGKYAASRLVGGEVLWHVVQLLVSSVVLTAIFAAVFRYLVKARVAWRDVRVGAVVTAVLFVIGKFGVGLYLGKAAVGSAFGAAGSIVVVLIWAYWSSQIFLFGLEFTHVYAQERDAA